MHRAIAVACILGAFLLPAFGVVAPTKRPAKPLAQKSPAEDPAEAALRAQWDINNPNKHDLAMMAVRTLESDARSLQREGERLLPTENFRSALTGQVTDRTFYREKGRQLVEQAQAKRAEANLIKSLVDKRRSELKTLALTSPVTPLIEWKNPAGAAIRAKVITFANGQPIVEREDGQLFQIPGSNIAPSYDILFDAIRLAAFGRDAHAILPYSGDNEAERGELIFTDSDFVWVRTAAKDVLRLPNSTRRDLRQELQESLRSAQREEVARDAAAGSDVEFVVQRILATSDYPDAAIFGSHLHEVLLGTDLAILATTARSFLSKGRGKIRIRHARSMQVLLLNGTTRTVPVLVEADPGALRQYEAAVRLRVACEEKVELLEANQTLHTHVFARR